MKDILLVNARCEVLGRSSKLEHLGLAYLSAALTAGGREVEILDANYFDRSADEVAAQILATPSRALGFSVFLNNARQTRAVLDRLAAAGDRRHVTLGGHHATFHAEEILAANASVDSIVQGEAEVSLPMLVQRLESGEDWASVPGVVSRNGNGGVRRNPCPPLVADLNALPFPDREPWAERLRGHGLATLVSSRGCSGCCTYCSIRAFHDLSPGRPWRSRSATNVVDEMEDAIRRYGVTHFEFADDNLIGPGPAGRERARRIGEEILARGLGVRFFFICRADCIDRDLLRFLKEAGLEGVDVGIESFIPEHLDLYDKRLTVEDNRRAVAVLTELGLAKRFYLIPSNPWARLDEIEENLREVAGIGLKHFPDSAVFNRLTVFRGSRLEGRLREEGLLLPPNPDFLMGGPLEYEFVHPVVKRFHAATDRIFQEYLDLSRELNAVFETPDCVPTEMEFVGEAGLSLRRSVFDLLRGVLAQFREGNEQSVPQVIEKWFAPLRQDVERIAAIHARGDFHRFRDVEVTVGGHESRYPPASVRDLARRFMEVTR